MEEINSDRVHLPIELRETLELAGDQENGIAKGLLRCSVCGDWIGRCLWPNPLLVAQRADAN
jgi:hypothetical protein